MFGYGFALNPGVLCHKCAFSCHRFSSPSLCPRSVLHTLIRFKHTISATSSVRGDLQLSLSERRLGVPS